jgi:hypothetical protein
MNCVTNMAKENEVVISTVNQQFLILVTSKVHKPAGKKSMDTTDTVLP